MIGAVVYLFDVLGVTRVLMNLPVLAVTVPARSAIVWSFCVAVLAGLGADALRVDAIRKPAWRSRLIVGASVLSFAGMVLCAFRARRLVEHQVFPSAATSALAWATLRHHVQFVVVTSSVATVLVLSCVVLKRGRGQRVAMVGVAAMVLLQGPFMMRGQGVTTPSDRFMNYSPRVEQIAKELGDRQTAWVDRARMLPNLNLGIPAYSPDSYDVVGIPTYTRLFEEVLGVSSELIVGGVDAGMLTGPYHPRNLAALQVLGISRVVTDRSYPFDVADFPAVRAASATGGGGSLDVQWSGAVPHELVLYTASIPDDERVLLTISGSGVDDQVHAVARVHGSLAVTALPADLPREGVLHVDVGSALGRVEGGKIVSTEVPGLRLSASIGGYQIFQVPGIDGFVSSPARAQTVANNTAAFRRVTSPGFDPSVETVIEVGSESARSTVSDGRNGRVSVTGFEPGGVTATVARTVPGYVVFSQNDYPGWRATVNGREAPVLRANSTFMAVKVPAGTSTVKFWFESNSMKVGAAISLGAVTLALVAFVLTFTRREERR